MAESAAMDRAKNLQVAAPKRCGRKRRVPKATEQDEVNDLSTKDDAIFAPPSFALYSVRSPRGLVGVGSSTMIGY